MIIMIHRTYHIFYNLLILRTPRLKSDEDLASGGNGQCFRVSSVARG